MNKLIVFPVFLLMFIALFSMVTLGMDDPGNSSTDILDGAWVQQPAGSGIFYWVESNSDDYWGPAINFATGAYYSPEGPYEESPFYLTNFQTGQTIYYESLSDFNERNGMTGNSPSWSALLDTNGFWAFFILAITGAGAAGIKIFGTGLSEYSQKMIFIGLLWGGIWVFLTVNANQLLMDSELDPFGWMLYSGLTITFIIGMIMEVQEDD